MEGREGRERSERKCGTLILQNKADGYCSSCLLAARTHQEMDLLALFDTIHDKATEEKETLFAK